MSTIKKITKNTGIIVAGNLLFRFISLIVTIYLARYLGVENYGKFNFLFAYLSFFTLITDFGLQTVLIREMTQNKYKTSEIIGNSILLTSLLSIMAFILSVTIISLLPYPTDTKLYVYIISISLLFISYSDVYTSIFRANLKMEYNLYAKITYRIFSAFFIFFIISYGGTLTQIVIVMVLAELIKLLLNNYYSKKFVTPKFQIDLNICRYLLRESIPIALTGIFAVIFHNTDIIMLSLIKGDASVGYYTAALKIIAPLGIIPSAMMMSLFPIISLNAKNHLNEKLTNVYTLGLKYTLLFSLPIAITVSFLSKNIIVIVFGTEFLPASVALIILMWTQILIFVGTINADTLISLHKQKSITKIALVGAVLNITLNLMLIPRYDFIGASIATIATEGLIIILLIFTIRKMVDLSLANKNIIKILVTNLVFALYFIMFDGKLKLYVLIVVSIILYLSTYFLIGGVNEDDKRVFRKLL